MQAVVFLLQHGPRGSLGLVLNHPTCERLGRDCRGEVALVRVSCTCSSSCLSCCWLLFFITFDRN